MCKISSDIISPYLSIWISLFAHLDVSRYLCPITVIKVKVSHWVWDATGQWPWWTQGSSSSKFLEHSIVQYLYFLVFMFSIDCSFGPLNLVLKSHLNVFIPANYLESLNWRASVLMSRSWWWRESPHLDNDNNEWRRGDNFNSMCDIGGARFDDNAALLTDFGCSTRELSSPSPQSPVLTGPKSWS